MCQFVTDDPCIPVLAVDDPHDPGAIGTAGGRVKASTGYAFTRIQRDSAAIVMVSSTAGQRGEANYSNYAASKGGQISFTKALASELCPKIRVNAVAPGWIETAMVRPVFDDEAYKQSVIRSIPLQRIATTDDIALSICFLLSDWSRHITGEILNVNGGSVLCG